MADRASGKASLAATLVVVAGVVAGTQWADRAYKKWWKKNDPMVEYRDRFSDMKLRFRDRGELAVDVALVGGVALLGIAQVVSMARERQPAQGQR